MKALFIGSDPRIFEEGSPERRRMRTYAEAIGELHILSRAPFSAESAVEGPLTLHPFRAGKLLAQVSMSSVARKLIEAHGIEVVSAQDPFEHGRIAFRAVAGTEARLHLQVHTDFLSPWFIREGGFRSVRVQMPVLNRVRLEIAKSLLPKASGIRVVSERIKRSLIEAYGEQIPEPSVIPVAVPSDLPPAVPLPPHPFTFALMTTGRLEPEKRIEDVLMALGRIRHDYPAVGLFIVGDGRERGRLEKLTKDLSLSDKVVFLGWRNDVLGLLQSASAYIQASAYEGYGRTLVEAALAKVPIITTDVGIVGEVFRGYEEVLSAPVADPAALALHIRGLVDDRQARMTYVMNAEHAARNHLAANADQPSRLAEDLAACLSR